jgi:uncharacterized protein YndB with AHSA1/START domain
MEHAVERELLVPDTADEVWEALAEPEWLGEGASIELREAGDVQVGERSGFVEQADAPRRLVFWWRGPDEAEATRVELDLEEAAEGTLVRVTETRPLALLDARGRDLEDVLGVGGGGPVALAGSALAVC